MPQYVLFLRGEPTALDRLSPEEMQQIIQKYTDWRKSAQSKIGAGYRLKGREGHVVRTQSSKAVVTDGPYTEAREVMGGVILIEADDD